MRRYVVHSALYRLVAVIDQDIDQDECENKGVEDGNLAGYESGCGAR